jgi:hypothetical protein
VVPPLSRGEEEAGGVIDLLSPASLARDEMRAADIGHPTAVELAVAIRRLPAGPERSKLEEWYWALVAEDQGEAMAKQWRAEYEWLRSKA